MPGHAESQRLLSYPFVTLCLVALFGFGNIAVFYGLYPYLESIGISPVWSGLILALEPMTAFFLRPCISPRLGPHNALFVMRLSLALTALALLSYPLTHSVFLLAAIRVVHGAAFVALVSAAASLLVHFIPPERSAQGFGVFTLITLLPFALMPPLTEMLLRLVPSAAHAYAWMSLVTLPALLLLARLGPYARKAAALHPHDRSVSGLEQIRTALATPGIILMLGACLCTFFSSSLLFFFMKGFAQSMGLANAGLFFTVSTGATIAVRLFGSMYFDKLDKTRALIMTLLFLAVCYGSYTLVRSPLPFLLAAAGFGAAMGVALPLLQSSLFVLADPAKRGLTTNLMLSTMDAGLFLGPYLGGTLLDAGLSHAGLFRISAGMALVACLFVRLRRIPNAPVSQP
ncbi:MAG: MFS transporter [Desulfovibrionaceae bacterium]